MRKFMYLAAFVCATLCLAGCALIAPQTEVVVSVQDATGAYVPGETVYLFSETDAETLAYPSKAYMKELTDEDGIARFKIEKAFFLLEENRMVMFITYDKEGKENGRVAHTLKRASMSNTYIKQTH